MLIHSLIRSIYYETLIILWFSLFLNVESAWFTILVLWNVRFWSILQNWYIHSMPTYWINHWRWHVLECAPSRIDILTITRCSQDEEKIYCGLLLLFIPPSRIMLFQDAILSRHWFIPLVSWRLPIAASMNICSPVKLPCPFIASSAFALDSSFISCFHFNPYWAAV